VAVLAIFLADRFFLGLRWLFFDAADGRGTAAFADILRHRPFAFAGALGFLQRRTYALAYEIVDATFTALDDFLFTRFIARYGDDDLLYLAFVCVDFYAAVLAYDQRSTLRFAFIGAVIIAVALVWRVSGAFAYLATAFVISDAFIFAFVFVAHHNLCDRAIFLLALFEFFGHVMSMTFSANIAADVCDAAFFAFIAITVADARFVDRDAILDRTAALFFRCGWAGNLTFTVAHLRWLTVFLADSHPETSLGAGWPSERITNAFLAFIAAGACIALARRRFFVFARVGCAAAFFRRHGHAAFIRAFFDHVVFLADAATFFARPLLAAAAAVHDCWFL